MYYTMFTRGLLNCGSDMNLKMRSIFFVSTQNTSRKQNRKIEFVARDINSDVCFFSSIE